MRKAKNKPQRSIILRILVIGVSLYMVCSLSSLFSTLNHDRAELKKLQNQRDGMKYDIDELTLKLQASETDLIIEAARDRLGYIFPDDEVYIEN